MNNIFIMSVGKTGIGKRMREIRTRMGLSQKEFAELVESSASSISGYELEDVLVPADVLKNIVIKCKVSGDWLLIGENPTIAKDANEQHLIAIYREAGKYPEHHEQEEIIRYSDWRIRERRASFGKEKGVPAYKGKALKYKACSG